MNARRVTLTALVGLFLTALGWHLAKAATDLETPYNTGQPAEVVSNVMTVQAAAYAATNVFGGKQALTVLKGGNRSAILRSVMVDCKVTIVTGFDFLLFSSDPSGTTFTEKSAISLAAADAQKIVAAGNLSTIISGGTPSAAIVQGLNIPIVGDGTNRTIWAVLIAKGATTPTGTADCSLRLGLELN